MADGDRIVAYDDLGTADLHIDRIYAGKTLNGRSLDPVSRIFGVGVQGGIRFKGSAVGNSVQLVVLYSTGDSPDWRDQLDSQTGILTYYGDNKEPGGSLLETHLRGNIALHHAFKAGRGSEQDRQNVPPFFYFERVQKKGSLVRFRGLAVPGAEAMTSEEELSAPWWSRDGKRFQNYCARFTILDAPTVSRSWIAGLVSGAPSLSAGCPDAWRQWVENRTYRALVAPSTDLAREIEGQIPTDAVGIEFLETIRRHFAGGANFQEFAHAVWQFMAPGTERQAVTRGGHYGRSYLGGKYLIGPEGGTIALGFVLDADTGHAGKPIADVSRLFSSLRHREFGVFVTLSYFAESVYHEVRADSHQVALVCGRDVVETLRREGFGDVLSVQAWLDSRFPRDTD
ncbi:restriction endonuclease [Nocardia suismassiliense]|uniref:Restriction endonuclease n=1 Tax=Nocardia suismassiliense TaxID=2077092 RepID=A0ABW6QWK1_9NOCA